MTFALPSAIASALLRATSPTMAGIWSLLAEDLHELVRVHAVLGGTLHEVLRELVLADLDLLGLGDRVEQRSAS